MDALQKAKLSCTVNRTVSRFLVCPPRSLLIKLTELSRFHLTGNRFFCMFIPQPLSSFPSSFLIVTCFVSSGATAPQWARASSFTRFLDHTERRVTVGRTPLDEWSARRRDLYLTTYNTHNRQTSMSPVGFEPTISAGERPQTYALYRAATGIGFDSHLPFVPLMCVR